ncbi:MAG: hypothetical protein PHI98_06725 [Eubacteriales bacterium]|nr:hypothetical protein [Eubacteriales bacterium]
MDADTRHKSQSTGQHAERPENMPAQAPPSRFSLLKGMGKPKDTLPEQKPVTDEEVIERKPAKWKTVLVRALTIFLMVLALALGYVFLLLGEPEEDTAYIQQADEEQIRMSMSALEVPGESNAASLAQTFGQPVLYLSGGTATMERARIYDTAFSGGYARRVTLQYAFSDGETLTVESIRPTAAVRLLGGDEYTLDANNLYTIGGVDAARMDSSDQICVFGQTGTAAYAVYCPKGHEGELTELLRQTALAAAEEAQP